MYMMLKWDKSELHQHLCPQTLMEEFRKFETLDTPDLHKRTDLEGILIPKSGQHRCGGIPHWVRKMQKAGKWQEV